MAALRRHVFIGKVLQKLYPEVPRGQEKRSPVTPASRNPPEKVVPERGKGRSVPSVTGGDTHVQPARRLYTVGLPPEGWVPPPPEPPSCSSPESSSSSEDTGDQELHEPPKRRRVRKHKSKKKFKNPNNIHVEQAELEKQQSLLQEKLQPPHTEGPTISKNKKRKLKKKQQIKRKKAAGLLTGASGVNFMYQPEDTGSEQDDVRASGGEDVPDAGEDGATDAREEDVEGANEKAESILNFLKSTQEIYFYDGVSKDSDSAVFMETTEELFKHLETHSMSSSDVFILDHMKTLLLLQDTERLKSALEVFPEHCRMPPAWMPHSPGLFFPITPLCP
ncbi:glutamate-rich protein 1 isoform X2 [Hippopotamus amphibius kiboko]|uniref:glutamate-rich protein 1 isoform X2 n=1 Tax=Hippopotamus amphibius kiboko TaxID=575201 RepID=UPI002592AB45|nr:glutamate-rich protein 1 isoform X2 [Hippopotamus amphibius kiboko]